MRIELKVPAVGESITEVMIAEWIKSVGESVAVDDSIVELESDKATVELPSPVNGRIVKLLKTKGEMAQVGEVIALIEEGDAPAKDEDKPTSKNSEEIKSQANQTAPFQPETPAGGGFAMPAAKRLATAKGVDLATISGSGPGGRILKEDIDTLKGHMPDPFSPIGLEVPTGGSRDEETVPMSPMRRTIAKRLVESQQQAALLTTFNEVDMGTVIALRKAQQEAFQQRYGIKLGFMSFFVKAAIDALKQFPQINAEIRGTDIVFKHYYDISIAVSGGKGLVTPVIRNAERLSFAQVEQQIADFGSRAAQNKITLEELKGGTFTISNGGIFGNLLSTPIVNPPQVAVLGLHKIEQRAVVIEGEIVARPMMYLALTYDHRLIDGRESVFFLKRIIDAIEEPSRMLLEV